MSKKKIVEQAGESVGFEKALARLESIVEEMETGTLSLEDMMKRFEEGQGLVKVCASTLDQVERRIEILMKRADEVVALPFDEDPGSETESESPDKGGLPF